MMNRLAVQLAVGLATFNGLADAFWRMPCERSGSAALDPLVSPGKISDHNHVIHGGTNFGMSTIPSDLLESESTSCEVTQDKSAYWTPSIHFMYPNGTTVMVPQVGGMLAYYLLYTNPGSEKITAFPEGFRMMAGDPFRRNFTCAVPEPPKSLWTGFEVTQPALEQKALGFNCLNYAETPEPSLGRHFLPNKEYLDANCLDGIRFELMFPSCWNGRDMDSPDHKSHMAYPDLVMTGSCPEGFPVKTPSIFFETIWNTHAFAGVDGQFVLATGDPTGYSYHGDYMPAWENNMLQDAVDTCQNPSGQIQDCPLFNIQSQSDAVSNTIKMPPQLANENTEGPIYGLPGQVPIFAGPEQAPVFPGNDSMAAVYPDMSPSSMPLIPSLPTPVPQVMGALPVNVVLPNDLAAHNTYAISATEAPSAMVSSTASSLAIATSAPTAVSSEHATSILSSSSSLVTPGPEIEHATGIPSPSTSAGGPISTEIYTKDNIVYNILIDEQVVTDIVTAPFPTGSAVERRHLRNHQIRHARRMVHS